jgi:hypothetical protein
MATEFSAAAVAAVTVGVANEISATDNSAAAAVVVGAAAGPTTMSLVTRLEGDGTKAEISAAPKAVALTAALDFVARYRRHALDRCRHVMVNTVFGDASPPGYMEIFLFLSPKLIGYWCFFYCHYYYCFFLFYSVFFFFAWLTFLCSF